MKQIEKPKVGKRYFIEVEVAQTKAGPGIQVMVYINGNQSYWFDNHTKFYTNEPEAMTQQPTSEWKPQPGDYVEFYAKNTEQVKDIITPGGKVIQANQIKVAKYSGCSADGIHVGEFLKDGQPKWVVSLNIRPITKTMREEIAFELGRPDNHYKVDKILEIFSRHNQPVMPSDDEIIKFYRETMGVTHIMRVELNTVIATVKHFLTRKA